jgi:mono/diheme cytochrome c family protein
LKNEHNGYNQDSAYIKKQAEVAGLLQNPYKAGEVLDRGKEIYAVNCQVCHGEKGEGNGQIVELPGGADGPYGARPPAYTTRLPQMTDGAMFFSISYGKGSMGGYCSQISPSDRWKVICYIKDLAGIKEGGAPASTPADSTKVAMK